MDNVIKLKEKRMELTRPHFPLVKITREPSPIILSKPSLGTNRTTRGQVVCIRTLCGWARDEGRRRSIWHTSAPSKYMTIWAYSVCENESCCASFHFSTITLTSVRHIQTRRFILLLHYNLRQLDAMIRATLEWKET